MSDPLFDIYKLLRRYNIHPDKSLGQNFLVDDAALEQVAAAAEITAQDVVLEIGPGLGSLTRLLARLARRVTAVELDARLIPALQEALATFQNVQVIQGDILKIDLAGLVAESEAGSYKVAANIPYNITSALIRHLLEGGRKPVRIVLTVQKEVAERICAAPGAMSLLALSVQVYGAARVTTNIPAASFYPSPQVDSAVVRIDLYPTPVIDPARLPIFFRLAKAGFSQRRKTLRNALAAGMQWPADQTEQILALAGIDSRRRAETLSLAEWDHLAEAASLN